VEFPAAKEILPSVTAAEIRQMAGREPIPADGVAALMMKVMSEVPAHLKRHNVVDKGIVHFIDNPVHRVV
ncbi:hypothetical protein, partial [Faecalibacillus intestinalis]|uniref:hypothetical protein n=1 Tax=Faecalibacillus intestinalis TaxID=1982626 RepID=UPI001EDEB3D4